MPDKKISELDITQSVTGDDVSVLVRDGADYQYSFSKLLTYLANNITTGNSLTFVTFLPQNTIGKNSDVALNVSSGTFYQKRNGVWTEAYSISNSSSSAGSILHGEGVPATGIGQVNDTYIDTINAIFYHKYTEGWEELFSMKYGPAGARGPKGDQGIPGVSGKSLLNGTVNPSNQTVGIDGDFYINTNSWQIFGPKNQGSWGIGTNMTQDIEGLGNLADLETDVKTDLVSAINEVLQSASNIDLSVPAWTVFGTVPFGKYGNKQQVPAAGSAYLQYKEAFQNVNAPVYTKPTVSQPSVTAKVTDTQVSQSTSTIEVGQKLDFNINSNITLNDSAGLVDGPLPKPLVITKNGTEIGTTDPTNDLSVVVSASSITYSSIYNYKGATIKNNDANEPDSRGQFGADNLNASFTITPRYKIFYGSIPSAAELSSDLLRGVSGGGTVTYIWENVSMPVSLNTGTTYRRFFVAVRIGSSKTLSSAKDVQTNGDVRSIYQTGKITMSIKNGGTGDVNYDVYVYEQAVAYGESHTHELILS